VAQSFLDVARELIDSPAAKASYGDDPDGFMASRGLDGLTPAELEAAVGFVAEAVPAPLARQLVPQSLAEPAPEPAALARLAATSEVEAEVREAEPGTVELAAVIDPAGELDLPEGVDLTTIAPAQEQVEQEQVEQEEEPAEEVAEAAAANGANEEQAGALDELPATGEAGPPVEPAVDEDGAEGEEGDEAEDAARDERDFELDPELQPTVDPTVESDTGLASGGPIAEPATVEPPPEETYDDLI
jgi:hypothetical protein